VAARAARFIDSMKIKLHRDWPELVD